MGNLKLRTLRCVFHTGTETSGCYKIINVLNNVNARGRHVALLCFATEVDYAQQSALPSRLCHFHEQPNGSVLTNASGQAQIILRSSAFRNSPRTVHVQANLRVQVQQHKREVNIDTEWVHCACSELVHLRLRKLRGHGCAWDGAERGKRSIPGLQSHSTWNYQLNDQTMLQVWMSFYRENQSLEEPCLCLTASDCRCRTWRCRMN